MARQTHRSESEKKPREQCESERGRNPAFPSVRGPARFPRGMRASIGSRLRFATSADRISDFCMRPARDDTVVFAIVPARSRVKLRPSLRAKSAAVIGVITPGKFRGAFLSPATREPPRLSARMLAAGESRFSGCFMWLLRLGNREGRYGRRRKSLGGVLGSEIFGGGGNCGLGRYEECAVEGEYFHVKVEQFLKGKLC